MPGRATRRIQTFPYWTSNPFVQMLYAEAVARGIAVTGNANVRLTAAALRDPSVTGLVHLQWPSPITDEATDAEDAEDAERRVDDFLDAVRTAQGHGRPVLWTVHNSLPHDTTHAAAARRLHQELADLADLVHVLRPATAAAVAGDYRIPRDRTVVVPHSSYHGVYGRRLDRTAARAALGVTAPVGVLFFGHLRPYKGLRHLFDAMRAVRDAGADAGLLLAGKPSGDVADLAAALAEDGVPITSALRFVDDDEVATWFSAADVVVLPYEKILNSGTMHLASTYGVPVVLPGEPHLVEDFGDEPWTRFFDPADPVASIAALLTDPWFRDPAVRDAAVNHARRFSPTRMSRAFADLVERMLAGKSGDAFASSPHRNGRT
ncbi:glycosyltransferase [Myceligenerans xiligouense]|uniref:Glycosyltransferase involved in cell wall biosynthesis n=1 Tax=Myceligenerans xiligouense TaxID=253184 RepID=A0A3N4Z4J0_9MICO|nr:glycosyltransferase [Myceligenerans xiligouense]RPF20122.1 glycosyltransferase involved in cell wall biosynthesis [Myceligenerans xiligouense]